MPRFWNVLHVRIYRKRNGRHNKKSNMADDPYLDCTVGQEDSAVMKENPLYFITNIQEDDDTHVWTDMNLFANAKKKWSWYHCAGPGLFVFYMNVVFLCKVEGGHWHHFEDAENERL